VLIGSDFVVVRWLEGRRGEGAQWLHNGLRWLGVGLGCIRVCKYCYCRGWYCSFVRSMGLKLESDLRVEDGSRRKRGSVTEVPNTADRFLDPHSVQAGTAEQAAR